MYNINLDKYLKLMDWHCVYWGIKKDLIKPEIAIVYANKLAENNPDIDAPEVIELLILDKIEKDNVLSLIEKMFTDKEELKKNKNTSTRKLRFVFLSEYQKTPKNNRGLLDKIELVYEDFNYPPDMEAFISYMPVDDTEYDVSKHTEQENEQRLVDKFNDFMESEYSWITKEEKNCTDIV